MLNTHGLRFALSVFVELRLIDLDLFSKSVCLFIIGDR